MRRFTRSMAALAVLLVGFAPAPAPPDDGGNITCRLDGETTTTQAVGTATCLQADPEGSGEFVIELVVTLQSFNGGKWGDVATEECTATSVNGIAQAQCVVTGDTPSGMTRALLDLVAPKDWAPAVAQPVYQGGEPVQEPLASDPCDVNEVVDDYDLTAPDAPWADLCAVTMEHDLDIKGETVESVTVTVHVAGLVDMRAETTSWMTRLSTADCAHVIRIDDSGVTGTAGVQVDSSCGRLDPEPCTGIDAALTELTGGSCSTGEQFEQHVTSPLSPDAVEYHPDQLRITFAPDDLDALAGSDFVAGRTVTSVMALTSTGVGSRQDGSRATVDHDQALSTGRTYTFD